MSRQSQFNAYYNRDYFEKRIDEVIEEKVEVLCGEEADFVTPYKDKFLDTSEILRDLYIQTRDLGILEMH